jgi:hypothetical protein
MQSVTDLPQYVLLNLGRKAAEDPTFLSKYRYLVDKPEPTITDVVFLHPLRSLFCDYYHITIRHLKEQTNLRRKFIAVALSLCNPEYVQNHRATVKDGLAETLSVLLGTQRDWISQQVGAEKDKINPPERIKSAYQAERSEIKQLCEVLYSQLSEMEGFAVERGCTVVAEMFTESQAQ